MPRNLAQILGATYRDDKEKLVPHVARHLMLGQEETDRRSDCIHPSEASHAGWCPRSTYYRIIGTPESNIKPRSLAMEMVFERGHDSHRKWQHWFWDMGILKGLFACMSCGLRWADQSPLMCPRCEVGRDLLYYAEVPVSAPEYLLYGHADGDVLKPDGTSTLIEVKTIGTGTVRFEAPAMEKKYSYAHTDEDGVVRKGVDWARLWSGIHRPFPAHLRQGMIYCFCYGRPQIVFIYDPKFVTAYPKEFEIKFSKEIIQDVLDECVKVRDALERGRPPKRPMWADEGCTACKQCPYEGECYGDRRSRQEAGAEEDPGQGGISEEGPGATKQTRVRFTTTPFGAD